MAQATTEAACIARHEAYPYDIGDTELSPLQRVRLTQMGACVRPTDHVLDVGCNSGYMVDFLPPGATCVGVDVSRLLVALARRRLADAQVARAEALPFEAGSFDVVLLGEILEHVFDPAAVLAEAARVARRWVVGTTPHEAGSWGTATVEAHPFHVRCYTRATLEATLAPFGQVVALDTIPDEKGRRQMYLFVLEPRPA